jgi:nondiscriminating glutamyl-tRNA synthetase
LGWSTEDSQDLFTQDELKQKFTVERCGKSPAIFDPNKLVWMNGEYIRKMPIPELVDRAMPFIQKAGFLNGQEEARVVRKSKPPWLWSMRKLNTSPMSLV